MNLKLSILLLSILLITSCHSTVQIAQTVPLADQKSLIPVREHSIQSVLWQQHAAEYRALSYQAFNLARLSLDKLLANDKEGLNPYAVVTDIDETVLNNSPYNGMLIKEDKEFSSATWKEWGEQKTAVAVPGALDFFRYCKTRGVEVFYNSNRRVNQQKETMENLKHIGFPYVDDQHMLLKEKTSGKEARRHTVKQTNEIIMLLGDNLSDFSDLFDKKPTQERNDIVDNNKNLFGSSWIVLPNPMYGDWETKGIYEGKYDWTAAQKDSIRREKVLAY